MTGPVGWHSIVVMEPAVWRDDVLREQKLDRHRWQLEEAARVAGHRLEDGYRQVTTFSRYSPDEGFVPCMASNADRVEIALSRTIVEEVP